MKKEYPDSDRRPKSHVCKNCKHIIVKIELPHRREYVDGYEYMDNDAGEIDTTKLMRLTAKATNICHESKFYCTFTPEWKLITNEMIHFCAQLVMRENWQKGYQDIERIWEEVDRVYATRYDCKPVPEKVRQAA